MKKLLLVAPFALLATGCAIAPTNLGTSLIQDTTEPILATDQIGNKKGQACAVNIFGLVTAGDQSIAKAKQDGNISRVATVDSKLTGFGVVTKRCTLVTGS